MVEGYYSTQVKLWLNNTIARRGPEPIPSLSDELAKFANKWQNTRWNEESLPSHPVGDPVKVVRALLKKYPVDKAAMNSDEILL